jgi:SAM-dependent methyltransferase
MTNVLHSAASTGFAKEAMAYSRGRPDYPDEVSDWLAGTLGVRPGAVAVDVGAGTGKFSRFLANTGAQIYAVEPVDEMREQMAVSLPSIQAISGTAQNLPIPDGEADVIVCAQAFHWFATSSVLAEFHRVLKPGGRLALVWNVRDESVDWVAALTRIISPFEGDAPRFYKGDWRRPFQQNQSTGFSALQETRFGYTHIGASDEVILDRFMSVSFIAALPEKDNAAVRQKISDLIATHPTLSGQAIVHFPYTTRAFVCTRQP